MNEQNGEERIDCEEKLMGILTRKGLGAGAVVLLFISILHSQTLCNKLVLKQNLLICNETHL